MFLHTNIIRKIRKTVIYNCNKKNKIPKTKANQGGERTVP